LQNIIIFLFNKAVSLDDLILYYFFWARGGVEFELFFSGVGGGRKPPRNNLTTIKNKNHLRKIFLCTFSSKSNVTDYNIKQHNWSHMPKYLFQVPVVYWPKP